MLKRNKLVFLLVFLLVFILAVPCLAKDNAKKEAIDKALTSSENKTAKGEKLAKAKNLEKEVKSFKRLELAYESLWITSAESRIRFSVQGIPVIIKINLSPKSRLDIYKALFRITPRIYVEGAYGSGDIQKGAPARIEINPLGSADGSLGGDNERMWNSALGFNLYKHAQTNLAIDIFGGYTYFRSKITGFEGIGTFWRTYEGPYFGLKLNAPFTIPEFPNNPFALKLKVGYGPRMTIKNRESLIGLLDQDISHSGKGYYLEARAALSWEIFKNLFLEAAYNYFRFKQNKDDDGIAASVLGGTPIILNLQNNSLTMHGPSAQVRYEF